MHFRILLIFLVFASFVHAQAQTEVKISEQKRKFDTLYIESLKNLLSVKIYGISKKNDFSLHDSDTNSSLVYSPNEHVNLGVGFIYKWLGLSAAFNIGGSIDDAIYGRTKKVDLQTNIYMRKFIVDLNFQKYKGYYLKNAGDFIPGFDTIKDYPIRPDVKTLSAGGSMMYFFNHRKFSYRSSFLQNEWQKKGAGSMLIGHYIYLNGFFADSSLVPARLEDSFNPRFSIKSAISFNQGLAAGYAYTFVIKKKLYITLSLLSGVSLTMFDARNRFDEKMAFNNALSSRFQARFATGYNSKKLYFGLSLVQDTFEIKSKHTAITQGFGNVKFFIGYRFRVKKEK